MTRPANFLNDIDADVTANTAHRAIPHGFDTVRHVTGTGTVADDDRTLIITPAADMTLTLPAAADVFFLEYSIGQIFILKRTCDTTGYTVTIDADGTETIDGELTQLLDQCDCLQVQSDGMEWHII